MTQRMTTAARITLDAALAANSPDLPLEGWEHTFTSAGDDRISRFGFQNAHDEITLVVEIGPEGTTYDIAAWDDWGCPSGVTA